MSAEDWEGCPICIDKAKGYFEYAKDKLPFDLVADIKSKMDFLKSEDSDGWNPKYDTGLIIESYEDKKLDEICTWAEYSLQTGTPVRIDYSYHISADGTYSFDFGANCTECGHDYTEEVRK